MQVRTPRDLGLLVKDRRRSLSLSQADLASRIGSSRHWVMGVEAGKPTVELGLVLKALSALGLVCSLRSGLSTDSAEPRAPRPLSLDLSRVLSRTRASGRTVLDSPSLVRDGRDPTCDDRDATSDGRYPIREGPDLDS